MDASRSQYCPLARLSGVVSLALPGSRGPDRPGAGLRFARSDTGMDVVVDPAAGEPYGLGFTHGHVPALPSVPLAGWQHSHANLLGIPPSGPYAIRPCPCRTPL